MDTENEEMMKRSIKGTTTEEMNKTKKNTKEIPELSLRKMKKKIMKKTKRVYNFKMAIDYEEEKEHKRTAERVRGRRIRIANQMKRKMGMERLKEEELHPQNDFMELLHPQIPIISKIPKTLWAIHPNAYHPKSVSVGPYHRHNQKLEIKVEEKQSYVERICLAHEVDLSIYRRSLRGLMPRIQSDYYDISAFDGMKDEEVLEMLVQDSCFVMELMLAKKDAVNQVIRIGGGWNDPILLDKQILALVKFDFLLAENQLPFIVLETLFNLLRPKPDGSLIELVIDFFGNLLPSGCCDKLLSSSTPPHFLHLLHLFHSCMTAVLNTAEHEQQHQMNVDHRSMTILTATDLVDDMGVEFNSRDDGSLWNITTSQQLAGSIEISRLLLTNNTISLYCNLIALEQQLIPKVKAPVSAYMMFMGYLIGSEKDLEVLRNNEVVCYTMTDENALLFFKDVCKVTRRSESIHFYHHILGQLRSMVPNGHGFKSTSLKLAFSGLMLFDVMLVFDVCNPQNTLAARHKVVLLCLIPLQMMVAYFIAHYVGRSRRRSGELISYMVLMFLVLVYYMMLLIVALSKRR